MKMQWAMKLPEAWRLLRANLKKDKSLGYMLLSIFVCVLIVGFVILGNTNPFTKIFDQEKAITEYILGICLYFSVLWLALVPMAVGGALTQEFSVNTWVFQQTAPQSARRLLLGKLLGAPANIYIATLGALPFLIVIPMLRPTVALPLFLTLIFLVICSFLFSCLFLYISCDIPSGNHNTTIPGITVLAIIAFLITAVMTIENDSSIFSNSAGSAAHIHPVSVYQEFGRMASTDDKQNKSFVLFFADDSKAINPPLERETRVDGTNYRIYKYDPIPHINFWGIHFGVIPFNIVFHLLLGLFFFFAAEGALLRKMSMGRSRIPQLISLILLIFFIFGFTFKMDFSNYESWQFNESIPLNAVIFWAILMYGSLRNARALEDLRPWLYSMQNGRRSFGDYFRDDAPVIYSTLLLLPFALAGFTLILRNYQFATLNYAEAITDKQIAACVSMLGVIVLRDTLFLQMFRLTSKKPDLRAALIYGVVFIGITFIASVANRGEPILDLTPFTALFITETSAAYDDFSFVHIYLSVNGLLALLFGAITQRHLNKRRESFRIENEVPRAA